MSDDDWETADLSTAAAQKPKPKPSLRAGATSFQPHARPSPPVEAGPSRLSPSSTGYIARSPINQGTEGGDDWFRGPRPASNRQIWDAANKHLPSALPTSVTNQGISIASPIPQPGITILRRQPGGETKKRGSGTQTPPKTISEREEEYRLARERIFGAAGSNNNSSGSGSTAVVGETLPGKEDGTRTRSSGGRSRTPNERNEGGRTASPNTSRLYDASSPQPGLGPVPVQIRRSPAPGILRQPMGPGTGGGFSRQEM